jgi:acetyl-CoA acyltransferase 1
MASSSTVRSRSDDDDDIVIVSALRTPLTRAGKGGLSTVTPAELLETVLRATLQSTGISGSDVDDVCVGNVLLPSPSGYVAMRMAAVAAGLPAPTTSFQTVNRQCASGLQAIAHIAQAIQAGSIEIGIAAGVESMSLFPMTSSKDSAALPEHLLHWDVVQNHDTAMDCLLPMGVTSDAVAREYDLERHVLDAFAVSSHSKAARARAMGKFRDEIVPVTVRRQQRNTTETTTTIVIDSDDGIRPDTNIEILSTLRSAFTPTGSTTAGNSSQTTDGAAAVLLMKRSQAKRRNMTSQILGIWRGYVTKGVEPRFMGIGPVMAIPALLRQTNTSMDQIDIVELNEAFASQAVYCVRTLGIPEDKVNPLGGAIALGHPLGATGTRMVATILHELKRRGPNARYGIVSMWYVT